MVCICGVGVWDYARKGTSDNLTGEGGASPHVGSDEVSVAQDTSVPEPAVRARQAKHPAYVNAPWDDETVEQLTFVPQPANEVLRVLNEEAELGRAHHHWRDVVEQVVTHEAGKEEGVAKLSKWIGGAAREVVPGAVGKVGLDAVSRDISVRRVV